jgi:hypothetical protein
MTRSDAEFFEAALARRSIELPPELAVGPCYTAADRAVLKAKIRAYLERKSGSSSKATPRRRI